MTGNPTAADRKRRIDHVVAYIFSNLEGQISLRTLAGVGNYSPFHLQKIFKQIIGDSPKQYIIKLRLETAFHLLIIHPQKSIQEIAADSGFSSPAVFCRAIKRYFGHSPEQIRQLSHRQKMSLLHTTASVTTPAQTSTASRGKPSKVSGSPSAENITIHTVKKPSVNGIYLLVPFDNPREIQHAFTALSGFANAHDRPISWQDMYGIPSPHQRNTYK